MCTCVWRHWLLCFNKMLNWNNTYKLLTRVQSPWSILYNYYHIFLFFFINTYYYYPRSTISSYWSKKKPGNNSFIVWFSDELIKTYRIKWYQAKILVRSQSRHFSLDTLFQVITEKTKCYIVLPSHVQMNMFYFV